MCVGDDVESAVHRRDRQMPPLALAVRVLRPQSQEQLAELEAILGLSRETDATPAANSRTGLSSWRTPDPKRALGELVSLQAVRSSDYPTMEDPTKKPVSPKVEASPPSDAKPFLYRAFRRGRVVADHLQGLLVS